MVFMDALKLRPSGLFLVVYFYRNRWLLTSYFSATGNGAAAAAAAGRAGLFNAPPRDFGSS
jgi:hypothetical protein